MSRSPAPGRQLATSTWLGRASELLAREAYLLDCRKFEEWVELFGEEGIYWVPLDPSADDPGESLNIAFEGPPRLRQRVAWLRSGIAHAQEPPSATVRAYGGVFVEEDDDDSALVRSALVVIASRLGRQTVVAARCEHRLATGPAGALTIARKRVDLADPDQAQYDLSFIL